MNFSRLTRNLRAHVNPLSLKNRKPCIIENYNQIMQNSCNPIHLDIGCGNGNMILELAQVILYNNDR